MATDKIEKRLADARGRLNRAIKALAPKHQGGEWEEYLAAKESVLKLERERAAAKREEYAIPLDFPVQWDIGAPLPYVIQNDNKTFLTFYVRETDPDWEPIFRMKVLDTTKLSGGSGDIMPNPAA
ncbi:MAG TPA: hypothetical protein VHS97_21870 [Isosphaeraceae bacterium]|jgi:hypothetical protein|nr:hypothetical protein [Isosphaeraceae bacterium]